MKERVVGLETERLCSYLSPEDGSNLLTQNPKTQSKEEAFIDFLREKYGAFQANGCNARAILPNQAQVYLDTCGKFLEICTPECSSVTDLVLHKGVSDETVMRAVREFNRKMQESHGKANIGLYFHNMSTDNQKRGTCGCHENYQAEKKIKYSFWGSGKDKNRRVTRKVLAPFLIARKLLEGGGLIFEQVVGNDSLLRFRISQRLEFIKRIWGANSTGINDRPIILERSEALTATATASPAMKEEVENFKRQHILSGEHNQSPFCDFVKFGSVSLLFEMIESGYFYYKERHIPWFSAGVLITGLFLDKNFFHKINKDLRCNNLYWCTLEKQTQRNKIRLCDILDIYAEWMFDYLESYSFHERNNLYLEKLEVAKKIKYAADCISRGDILALDEEIDWVIKLRWLQNFIKMEAGIEIDDSELLSGPVELTSFLRNRWGSKRIRNGISFQELLKKILVWQASWHQFDPKFPKESDYHIVKDCGLIKPLTVDNKIVDLSTEPHMNKVPMNPPNRTWARKKLADFVRKVNLSSVFFINWEKAQLKRYGAGTPEARRSQLTEKLKGFKFHSKAHFEEFLELFPWNREFHFYHPQKYVYQDVDAFIEWVESLIDWE